MLVGVQSLLQELMFVSSPIRLTMRERDTHLAAYLKRCMLVSVGYCGYMVCGNQNRAHADLSWLMCHLCLIRRNVSGVTEGVDIPPVGKTALTWAFFMGTSSNVRYQVSATNVGRPLQPEDTRTCGPCR